MKALYPPEQESSFVGALDSKGSKDNFITMKMRKREPENGKPQKRDSWLLRAKDKSFIGLGSIGATNRWDGEYNRGNVGKVDLTYVRPDLVGAGVEEWLISNLLRIAKTRPKWQQVVAFHMRYDKTNVDALKNVGFKLIEPPKAHKGSSDMFLANL